MNLDRKKIEELARKNISDCTTNLRENKEAIELLTLTRGYKSIFKLKDDDWVRLSGMNISMRKPYEQVIQDEKTLELIKLAFGESD